MPKIWEGKKFIAQEDGKEIIINALNHYKRRLETIESDEHVKEMGMSIMMLFKHEAQKNLQKINPMIIRSSPIPFFPILFSGKVKEYAARDDEIMIAPIITPHDAIT